MAVKSMLFVLPIVVDSQDLEVFPRNFVIVLEATWETRQYMHDRMPAPGSGFVGAAYCVPDPQTVGVFQAGGDTQLGPYKEDVEEAIAERTVHVYVEPGSVMLLSSKKQRLRGTARPYFNFSYQSWSVVIPGIGSSVELAWDHFDAVAPSASVPPTSEGA